MTSGGISSYTGCAMIQGYRDRRTAAFAAGEYVAEFQGFEDQAARRLSILNAARSLDTLRALRGNRLEVLRRGSGRTVLHKDQSSVARLFQLA